ncbi:hypothetical protein BGZ94_006201 [Podila epigama]|nr:hypothetical protein BGZ94_006201 [Podila epigama]
MASALDMSLDDIIKSQKANRPARNSNNNAKNTSNAKGKPNTRGGRGSGPTRNTRQSRDKKPYNAGVQQYRATPVAPLHTAVIRQNAPDGSKIQVSNLDHRVSADDLKLVFQSRVGPLKKCTLMYDQHGKSTGTAVVHFSKVGDAAIAYQKFNTVPLDGRPMKIEIVLAPTTAQAVLPQAKATRAANNNNNNSNNSNNNNNQNNRTRGNNARGGRGRGRGARNGTRKEAPKTAEQLDAEMNDYMQVDA